MWIICLADDSYEISRLVFFSHLRRLIFVHAVCLGLSFSILRIHTVKENKTISDEVLGSNPAGVVIQLITAWHFSALYISKFPRLLEREREREREKNNNNNWDMFKRNVNHKYVVTSKKICESNKYSDQTARMHEELMHPWLSKNALCEDSDQTERKHRLIWIFAGRTCPKVS